MHLFIVYEFPYQIAHYTQYTYKCAQNMLFVCLELIFRGIAMAQYVQIASKQVQAKQTCKNKRNISNITTTNVYVAYVAYINNNRSVDLLDAFLL